MLFTKYGEVTIKLLHSFSPTPLTFLLLTLLQILSLLKPEVFSSVYIIIILSPFLFSTQQSHYRPENACQNKIFFSFTLMWTSAAFFLTASNILFSGNILLFSKLVVFESKLIYKERSNMEIDSHTLFCKYLICWYHNIVPNFLIQTHVFLWP